MTAGLLLVIAIEISLIIYLWEKEKHEKNKR